MLLRQIARGGMATIHLGRMLGPNDFSRRVAIKRLLPQFACDEQFTTMLLDEARLSACVSHPNVTSVIDVVQEGDELWLVLEYVEGDSLARLLHRHPGVPLAPALALRVAIDLLHGLAAVHEARDERGEPLAMVHRDVSPQNIMVGTDGLSRLLDFGIAKARTSIGTTRHGEVKGKLSYLAPELLRLEPASAASDLYAAGVVMWEALVGRRLLDFATHREAFMRREDFVPPPPSAFAPRVPPELDAIVSSALAPRAADRPQSARSLLAALEAIAQPASRSELRAWVLGLHDRPSRPADPPRPSTPSGARGARFAMKRSLSVAVTVVGLVLAGVGCALAQHAVPLLLKLQQMLQLGH